MAVVSLVESQFWMRRNDRVGALQKYVDSAWRTVAASDRAALCKTEAQLWLIVTNLCMDAAAQQRYHMHSYRKNQLMRLKKFMNEVLVDQLPPLRDLQRYLEELALYDPPPPTDTPFLLIEQVRTAAGMTATITNRDLDFECRANHSL